MNLKPADYAAYRAILADTHLDTMAERIYVAGMCAGLKLAAEITRRDPDSVASNAEETP